MKTEVRSQKSEVRSGIASVLLFILMYLPPFASAAASGANSVFLFSFFREPNGTNGLQLATSTDDLKWTEIKAPNGKSFLEPQVGGKLMRDPSIALGPDGTFHMVWTTSWGRPPVFGYASSKDLITWSEQRAIPVMENEPGCKNVWAPEQFYDVKNAEWLIFWSSTIPGRYPETDQTGDNGDNHRVYYTTTKDFTTFAPTKLFFNDGFNVIDATMLSARGKFYLIVKDETKTPVKKNLRIAVSDQPEGPFGHASPTISTNWVEGPTAIQIDSDYYIFFDHYTQPQYYGAVKSSDLEHWRDISPQVSFPKGARHGTVLSVPEAVVRKLQSFETNTTKQP
jgi:beta-xylosidase